MMMRNARGRTIHSGHCLNCAGCNGMCREILDLIFVPPIVLRPKPVIR